ncbi:MAG: response regulator, partial [Deltaproteobacteria bacterium]|nr:response regulator [Deltaproteobacteria bacterium]
MDLMKLVHAHLGEDIARKLVPGKVLAVDDDGGNLVILDALLSDSYTVTTTLSPKEALKLVETQEFDMVLSDQRMPEMTGVELLKLVRERHPYTVRVIVSAYSDARAILQAINEGEVYRFILKPWEPEDVLGVVRQGLEYRLSMLSIRRLGEELHKRNVKLVDTLDELRRTQQKLLESAKLATVGQLTGSIIRELKNHVTGVKMLADMTKDMEVPPALAEYIRVGADSAQSLFDLVGGLGSFAASGEWRLRRSRSTLNLVAEEALRVARLDPRCASVLPKLELDPALPLVPMDAEKMRQVVVNLLLNALDATPAGGRIVLSTYRGAQNKGG